jgi:hypothetical protein
MAEFSRGLLAGFSTMDSVFERRAQRGLEQQRIGLAQAAEERAMRGETYNRMIVDEERDRRAQQDQAARLLTRAERLGPDALSDEDVLALEESAPFHPGISAFLSGARQHREAVGAMQSLAGSLRQPRASLSDVAAGGGDSAAAGQMPVLAQEQAMQAAGGTEMDPAQGGGRRMAVGELRTILPGVQISPEMGVSLEAERTGRVTGGTRVDVPDWFMTEAELSELPLPDRERMKERMRVALGDTPTLAQSMSEGRQARQDIASKWRQFLDPQDAQGEQFRVMAASDPMQLVRQLRSDFNTIKDADPNLAAVIGREMEPVVREAMDDAVDRMADFQFQGAVDPSNPEFRAIARDMNETFTVMQTLSDQFRGENIAALRNRALPRGNAQLAGQMVQNALNTPEPGYPFTGDQFRAQAQLATRAVDRFQNEDARSISAEQVNALLFMMKNGMLTPTGMQNFLEFGSFQLPQDAEVMGHLSHNPNNILYQTDPQGRVTGVLYTPPEMGSTTGGARATAARNNWPSNQLDVVNNFFQPMFDEAETIRSSSRRKAAIEEANRVKNGFLVSLYEDAESVYGLHGFDINRMSEWTPHEMSVALLRYASMNETANAYNNRLAYKLLGWTGLARSFEDLPPEERSFTNFDQLAQKWTGSRPVQLPANAPNVDAAYADLLSRAAAGDRQALLMYLTVDREELSETIMREAAQQGPRPLER